MVTKSWFSAATRTCISDSCRMMSQKMQRSLLLKYFLAPSSSSTTCLGMMGRTISQDFRRRGAFIAGTKWTEAALQHDALTVEIAGALGAVSGNDYPASGNGVLSQFRHEHYLTTCSRSALPGGRKGD